MLVISYLGNTYTFPRKNNTEAETDAMFRDRCWWIVKNIAKGDKDKKTIIALSHVWVSIKYYGATYDDSIIDVLKTCEDVYTKK